MDLRLRRPAMIVIVLIAIGVIRISLTYRVFNQTVDEPAHVAAGLEWIDRGRYKADYEHPPLGRVFAAIGPFLSGARYVSLGGIPYDGNAIFHYDGRYWRNLTLARVGILPFFVLGAFVVWRWSRLFLSDAWSIIAVFLFTTTPVVLGHSGVATTDIPFTGTFVLALYATLLAFRSMSIRAVVCSGIAAGLALLSKFSFVLFYPPSFVVLGLGAGMASIFSKWRRLLFSLFVACALFILVIWAGYQLSYARVSDVMPVISTDAAAMLRESTTFTKSVSSLPFPAPELIRGLSAVRYHNRAGHAAYLLGRQSKTGWWYYFPIALILKTPIPLLLLTAVAIVMVALGYGTPQRKEIVSLLAIACSILIVGMTSSINIGVRHMLPIYPLLAMCAGSVSVVVDEPPGRLGGRQPPDLATGDERRLTS